MGICVEKIGHSCGTRDGLQVFKNEEGEYNGYCYACNTYVSDPYASGGKPPEKPQGKTPEQIAEELEEIGCLGSMDLTTRRLRGKYLERYGVKVGLSEKDGKTPSFAHFPYHKDGELLSYKTKLLQPKRMWWTGGKPDDCDLFGWSEAIKSGARRLVITEGEWDTVALTAIFDIHQPEQYEDNIPAFVSLPHGAGTAGQVLSRLANKINKHFKEVTLCFDSDEAGEKAVQEGIKALPHANSVSLPCKDANECLINGVKAQKGAHKAIMFNTYKPKNSRLVWGEEVHESAKKPAEWGLSTPYDGLTEITRGWRYGETVYIASGEKMGKSELVNTLASHLITEHKVKVLLAKPEEANNKTYKLLCGKVAGKVFHDPKREFDEEAYETAGKKLRGNVCMLNLYQNIKFEGLVSDIKYAHSEGVRAVFIDPITNLTNGMNSTEVDAHLRMVAQELASLAKDLDIIIFIFCHLNKPKGGTPWDRGGKITTDYFAGSSAMARSCNYAIGMEGNKDPELSEMERNMRTLVILADREFGESGNVKLYWDKETGLFNEVNV